MSHLHDISVIRKAAEDIFETLKAKFDFRDCDFDYGGLPNEAVTAAMFLHDLIIYTYIDKREGCKLYFRKRGWPAFMRRSVLNLILHKFGENESVIDDELKMLYAASSDFKPNTYNDYYNRLRDEIRYVEKYFPEILEKGILL